MATRAPQFITLEGIDGVGKSTQVRLLAEALRRAGYDVLSLREPGGAKIAERIRGILLDPANTEMGDTCELLLYEAARAQLVHQVIKPALAAGRTVVCDRFFDSTTAYQAYADGIDPERVRMANRLAVDGCVPDVTLVLDMDVDAARARMAGRGGEDRMEAKGFAFQRRVAGGFRAIAEDEPGRVKLIDAAGSRREVFGRLMGALREVGVDVPPAVVEDTLAAETADEGDPSTPGLRPSAQDDKPAARPTAPVPPCHPERRAESAAFPSCHPERRAEGPESKDLPTPASSREA